MLALSRQTCQGPRVLHLAAIERWYLWHALDSLGATVRAHPVEPGCFAVPMHRALYRALCDVMRAACPVRFDALAESHREAIEGLYLACNPTLPVTVLTADGYEITRPFGEPDVAVLASELRAEYARRKLESRLLAELEMVRADAWMPEEACE